jgi:FAD/FMN-containing dehydrogenase
MAKRRKQARKTKRKTAKRRMAGRKAAATRAATRAAKRTATNIANTPAAQSLMQVAERAVRRQSNKVLDAATKRYNRLMRQAARATNDANKRKYLAAALTAVVVAGVVANDLKRRIDKSAAGGRKKRL